MSSKLKPLIDIRYFETAHVPPPGAPFYSDATHAFGLSPEIHQLGQRIACVLESEKFSVGTAAKLVHEYTEAIPEDPKLFTIALQTSPWRFYDAEMRILMPEELAAMIKAHWKQGMEKVVLQASWTGVAPDRGGKSLAQKLSDALGGFPVTGMDGFLWMSKDGSTHTTHQAFSMKQGSGPYFAMEGDDVMVSLAAGWYAEVENLIVEKRDAEALMRAGAAWDLYELCPEHALKTFEAAAKMSNSIAAYDAALMRLERNGEGDVEAAKALLSQAAEAGGCKDAGQPAQFAGKYLPLAATSTL